MTAWEVSLSAHVLRYIGIMFYNRLLRTTMIGLTATDQSEFDYIGIMFYNRLLRTTMIGLIATGIT